jgi:SAM-dependent methyltransferase
VVEQPDQAAGWKASLASFFSERADAISTVPTRQDLCYIAGRDPRIWTDDAIYSDLIASIATALHLDSQARLLEVGCASGFLAQGLAPRVRQYIGVDLSAAALAVAKRLRLPNATLRVADGTRLPFADHELDAATCYDVFTNFPDFSEGAGIIKEMFRVVKPGGRVLVGSVPDQSKQAEFNAQAAQIAASIESRFGAPLTPPAPRPPNLASRLRRYFRPPAAPAIVCYDFRREDFIALGRELGAHVQVRDIHPLNPYVGYRFNVVYTKPE